MKETNIKNIGIKTITISVLIAILCIFTLTSCSGGNNSAKTSSFSTIKWPTNNLAKLIPEPKNLQGKIYKNTSEDFFADVVSNKDEFKDYANKCKALAFSLIPSENGFDLEEGAKVTENSFKGYDGQYHVLTIYFSKTENVMSIKIKNL